MPNLADAVLLSATAWPGEKTAASLAKELDLDVTELEGVVKDLRKRGFVQKRRGSPKWGGLDRLRASKAGRNACRETLRAEILGE